jgi:hypothetical protein
MNQDGDQRNIKNQCQEDAADDHGNGDSEAGGWWERRVEE